MFTGIIEGLGTITAAGYGGEGKRLAVKADFNLEGSRVGDSIAIDGACLTVTSIAGSRFEADVSPETASRTTLETASPGRKVNIERALRLSDRLDGHLVSGHIDGTGRIEYRETSGNSLVVGFSVPRELSRYMIEKGSVAVDGVSLTINSCSREGFEVTIIPHTAAATTIGHKTPGEHVNIETDIIGRYVEKFLAACMEDRKDSGKKDLDIEFLSRTGFI